MRLNAFDLNLFVVFDTVYRERNLSRAADVLNITQPAVSNALQRMRDRLGDKLFYRVAGGVAPTPAAQSMISAVREALGQLDACIQQTIKFVPENSTQHFRLGLSDFAEAILLPRLLQTIHLEAPGLTIQSITVPRRELATALIQGNVDLSLETPFLNDPQISSTPLLEDDYVCLLRPHHPALEKKWTMKTFLQLEHVHTSSRPMGAGMVDAALSKLGKSRKVAFRAQHYMAAPEIVRQTDLVLCVPSLLAALFPDLIVRSLPLRVDRLQLNLYRRKNADQYGANSWLFNRVQKLGQQVGRSKLKVR